MPQMTSEPAELAVTGHVGQVVLALGDLMHTVVVTWSDERRAWRVDLSHEDVRRVFWFCARGWRYEWLGRSWWRPTLWPVLDEQRLAAEMVLVLAGLVSWPASIDDHQEGQQPGSEGAGVLVSQDAG